VLALGAAVDEEVCDLAETVGAGGVGGEIVDGLGCEVFGDLVGTLQAKDAGVGGFLLGDVFAGGFAEGGRGFFHVEDVVGDLKSPADGFAEVAEALNVLVGRAGTNGARGDGSAD